MNPKSLNILRWIARIWAALMAGSVLFIFIAHIVGDGIGSLSGFTARDALMMPSMLITIIGLVVAWKWERVGGWMTVGGMLAFYLFDFLFTGTFPQGGSFLLIAFPGLLFLLLTYLGKSQETI